MNIFFGVIELSADFLINFVQYYQFLKKSDKNNKNLIRNNFPILETNDILVSSMTWSRALSRCKVTWPVTDLLLSISSLK